MTPFSVIFENSYFAFHYLFHRVTLPKPWMGNASIGRSKSFFYIREIYCVDLFASWNWALPKGSISPAWSTSTGRPIWRGRGPDKLQGGKVGMLESSVNLNTKSFLLRAKGMYFLKCFRCLVLSQNCNFTMYLWTIWGAKFFRHTAHTFSWIVNEARH